MFMIYWFRNGEGVPAKEWPSPMSFGEAFAIARPLRNRVRGYVVDKWGWELRYEPLALFKKFTSKHPARAANERREV